MNRTSRRATTMVVALLAVVPLAGCGAGRQDLAAGETRSLEHLNGTVEVPLRPERVVAIDQDLSMATAQLLGVPVLGVTTPPTGDEYRPYLDLNGIEEVADLGWYTELNVERILGLQPDLIIGQDGVMGPGYERLSRIAPTVVIERDPFVWQTNVRRVADALGRADEIEDEVAAAEQRIAEVAAELAEAGITPGPATLLNIRSADDLRIYTRSCAAGVLDQLGFDLTYDGRAEENEQYVQVSVERLPEADAAHVFYIVGSTATNPRDSRTAFAAVSAQPLWNQLTAVQDDAAYSVEPAWWFGCGSVQATERIVDDVESLLLGR